MWDILLFSYTTKVVMLGNTAESLEIGDLPIVAADMRATALFANMRSAMRRWKLRIGTWRPTPGSGAELAYRILRVNGWTMGMIVGLAAIAATMFYVPAFFLQRVVHYLEVDPTRESRGWGFLFCAGLFFSNAATQISKFVRCLMVVQAGESHLRACYSHGPIVVVLDDDPAVPHAHPAELDPVREDARAQGRRVLRRGRAARGREG